MHMHEEELALAVSCMEKLVNYSSSSDSDLEDEADEQSSCAQDKEDDSLRSFKLSKRKCRSLEPPPAKRLKDETEGAASSPFTLPSAILDMFNEESESGRDTNYQGRIRSFPHVRGNWATHVFISVEFPLQVLAHIERLKTIMEQQYSSYEFHSMPQHDLHVSLSRTVPIQHHWIEPLTDSLRSKFKLRHSFVAGFRDISFYVNDEGTRSFVSLDVATGHDKLLSLVQDVDDCFSAYRLPGYYENPVFHVSLHWCVGDITKSMTSRDKTLLQEQWNALLGGKQALELPVAEIRCKIGNKVYSFNM